MRALKPTSLLSVPCPVHHTCASCCSMPLCCHAAMPPCHHAAMLPYPRAAMAGVRLRVQRLSGPRAVLPAAHHAPLAALLRLAAVLQGERGHSCPPFDLVNSAGMKLVVRGASPKRQQYSGTCFIVEFESLLIKMGLGRNNIAKLTTRDDNPQFPENRRCAVFRVV
ncbi:unnamed protein product [Closterium sp. Naga37s-1]|nr:unnamed protein product [Closterium sp. Naga37s-1]